MLRAMSAEVLPSSPRLYRFREEQRARSPSPYLRRSPARMAEEQRRLRSSSPHLQRSTEHVSLESWNHQERDQAKHHGIDSSIPAMDYARSVLQRNTEVMQRQLSAPIRMRVQLATSISPQMTAHKQRSPREDSRKASPRDHRTRPTPLTPPSPTIPQSPALSSASAYGRPVPSAIGAENHRVNSQFESSLARFERQTLSLAAHQDARARQDQRGVEELRKALRELESRCASEQSRRMQAEQQWAADVRACEAKIESQHAKIETLSRSNETLKNKTNNAETSKASQEALCDKVMEKREQCWAEDFEALRQQLVQVRVTASNREREAEALRKRVQDLEALASRRLRSEQEAQAAMRRVSEKIRDATTELLSELKANGASPVGYVAELLQQLEEINAQLGSYSPKRKVSEVPEVSKANGVAGKRMPVSPSSGKTGVTTAELSSQTLQALSSSIPAWCALIKYLAKDHRSLTMQREAHHTVAEQSITTLLATGRAMARASRTLLRRVQRVGSQLAAGKNVRCTKVGSHGRPECFIWGGEWAPLNGDLPAVQHAVAAWLLTASEAKAVVQRLRSGVNADELPMGEETFTKEITDAEIAAYCSSDNEGRVVEELEVSKIT